MTRRVASIVVCLVAVAGVGLFSAPTGSPFTPPLVGCGAPGSRTIVQNGVARVYRRGDAVYGCASKTRLRTRLGASGIGARSDVGLVKLGHACAAYEQTFHGVDSGSATVVVTRLTDGKQLGSAPAIGHSLVESFQSVTSLVVKRGGAVAWIGRDDSIIRSDYVIEVHKLVPGGRSVLLDSGKAIDPSSLRLHKSRLTWTDGGATRSATLP